MKTKLEIDEIIKCLENEYPEALCSLQYEKPHELLFAVRLAAQCTDERVNKVTPALYERFPSLEAFAEAEVTEVEKYVHSTGFFRAKARDIVACSKMLLERHNGIVPDNMEDLCKLAGVGRKTANLILGDVYKKPAYVVDTHCIRLSNRIGIVEGIKEPVKIERVLREVLPSEKSSDYCHRMVLHGRAVCSAHKADCENCCISHVCSKNV